MTFKKPRNDSRAAVQRQDGPHGRQEQAEAVARRREVEDGNGGLGVEEVLAQRYWSGALPRPEDFQKYNEVVPDASERILVMAEKEQEHRIALENRIIPANAAAGVRGQWLGSFISILALVLAAMVAIAGAPWQVSVALVGVPVLSVARSLVTAFRKSDDD